MVFPLNYIVIIYAWHLSLEWKQWYGKLKFTGTRKFDFPERAGMTFVIGQIQEELKLGLAYQRIPSKLICQRTKDARRRWGDDGL